MAKNRDRSGLNTLTVRLSHEHHKALRLAAEVFKESNQCGAPNVSRILGLVIERDEKVLAVLATSLELAKQALKL